MEKTYKINTKFIFSGYFEVKANSLAQAKEYIKKHCGLVIGSHIHSTLPDEDIEWNFNVHPEKVTGRSKRIK